jgi:hypothetical protein
MFHVCDRPRLTLGVVIVLAMACGPSPESALASLAEGESTLPRVFIPRDLRFRATPNFAAQQSLQEVTRGDFDDDGKLDLVAVTPNSLQFFRGQGDSTFTSPVGSSLALRSAPHALSTGDVDGDGYLDVVTSDFWGMYLSRNLGDGSFGPPETITTSAWTAGSSAIADFDRDGLPDVLATYPGTSQGVYLLRGLGGGVFAAEVSVHGGAYDAERIAVANFDRRKGLDYVVTDQNGTVTVLLNNGRGAFTASQTFTGVGPKDVTVGDIDEDGEVDLVVASTTYRGAPAEAVNVFLGHGDGTFGPAISTPVPLAPYQIAAGDLDGDGTLDVAVAEPLDGRAHVLLGMADGTFEPPAEALPGTYVGSLLIGRFDHRSKAGLVLVGPEVITLIKGEDDEFFGTPSLQAGSTLLTMPVLADVDHDELPDLVVAENNRPTVHVLLGDGESFDTPITLTLGTAAVRGLGVGDFDQDSTPDLITAGADLSISRGNGDGTFQPPTHFASGVDPDGMVTGDFNGDQKIDVVVLESGGIPGPDGKLAFLAGDGNGGFLAPIILDTGVRRLNAVIAGDLNGDGRLDVLAAGLPRRGSGTGNVNAFIGNGDGTFQDPRGIELDQIGSVSSLVIQDVNGDGYPDIVGSASGNINGPGGLAVALGTGDGSFVPMGLVPLHGNLDSLVAADFDQDGHIDLGASRYINSVAVLRGNSDGTFIDSPGYVGAPNVTAVVAGDLDDDGRLDLVATGGARVGYLFNTSPPRRDKGR